MKTSVAALLASVIAALGGGGPTTTVPSPIEMSCVNISKTLWLGMKDPDVATLQTFLNVKPTGYFGPMTRVALIRWQKSHGIIISPFSAGAGIAGPRTRTALECHIEPFPISLSTTTATSTATSTATTSLPVAAPEPPAENSSNSSRPTDTTGGIAPGCPAFTKPEPAMECQWGEWQKAIDESGCYIDWDCSDPNPEG